MEEAQLSAILATVLILATACSRPATPVTAATLMMPPEEFPGVTGIETRNLLDDGSPTPGNDRQSRVLELLREQGLTSTAIHRYRLASGGRFEVHVDVFRDAWAADRSWASRYQARTRAAFKPLPVGSEGWRLAGRAAGFRIGNAIIEIRAESAAAQLESFARAYAEYAAEVLALAGETQAGKGLGSQDPATRRAETVG